MRDQTALSLRLHECPTTERKHDCASVRGFNEHARERFTFSVAKGQFAARFEQLGNRKQTAAFMEKCGGGMIEVVKRNCEFSSEQRTNCALSTRTQSCEQDEGSV